MTRTTVGILLVAVFAASACTTAGSKTSGVVTTTITVTTLVPETTLLDEGVTRVIPVPSVVQTTTSTTLGYYATLPTRPLDEKLVELEHPPADGPLTLPTDPVELEQLRQNVSAAYENATMLIRQDFQDRQNGEPANIVALEAALDDPYLGRFARNRLEQNIPYLYESPEIPLYDNADGYIQIHPLVEADLYAAGIIDLWVCEAAETTVTLKETGEVADSGQRESARTVRMRFIDGDWRLVGFLAVSPTSPHKEDGGCWDLVPEPVY